MGGSGGADAPPGINWVPYGACNTWARGGLGGAIWAAGGSGSDSAGGVTRYTSVQIETTDAA
jgi:hypothetical protein